MMTTPESSVKSVRDQWMDRFFLINYLLVLGLLVWFAGLADLHTLPAVAFLAAVVLAYSYVYLVPAGLVMLLARQFSRLGKAGKSIYAKAVCRGLGIAAFSATLLFLVTDRQIYKTFGFHYNGFIWNILTTKGGFESMGFDRASMMTAIALVIGIVLAEGGLLWFCIRWEKRRPEHFGRRSVVLKKAVFGVAVVMFAAQAFLYGFSSFYGESQVLVASNLFPLYLPITFRGELERLGLEPRRESILTADASDNLAVHYPLAPLEQTPGSKPLNIVWLVAESWRADMLQEEIMPQTTAFARKAQWFTDHYSSGNGTRMGLFGMFYGLYGNYWFPFLKEQQPPVLMDLLRQNGYQMDLFTSAAFSYPEFDKTVFAGVPSQNLHEGGTGAGWERDRQNVGALLDFIRRRDPGKPFMTFMFFESPHARYYFPPECAIRKDYLQEFNYVTTDVQDNIQKIFNRYVNSCNHLDSQLGRVIDGLEEEGLLDSTIVIITGDHGEEFMEEGRWGHNSAFTEEQVRVPLVMWVPGKAARIYDQLTSHLDIAPTVLDVLGVRTPPAEYSMGVDLFGNAGRTFTVFSNWDSVVYSDPDCKIVLPFKSFAVSSEVTSADDQAIPDADALYGRKVPMLSKLLKQMGTFAVKL